MKLEEYIKSVLKQIPDSQAVTFELNVYPNSFGEIYVCEVETGNKIKFTLTRNSKNEL